MIATHLGTEVVGHDDGSKDGMYDLEIRYPDGRRGAIEVVAAADPEAIQFWNLANGGGTRWVEKGISGGWAVECKPSTRVKDLRSQLPLLLKGYESLGITQFDSRRRTASHPLDEIAQCLGITHAMQSSTDFPGSIYLMIDLPAERTGTMVSENADAAAAWIGSFLKETRQQDVLSKLRASGVDERHAFVIFPGFSTAPYSVIDPLIRPNCLPPTIDPELPDEVTDVWMASTWSVRRALFWSSIHGWQSVWVEHQPDDHPED